jgi:hypothetical protein
MPTSITPADLTVTITTAITLNGQEIKSENILTVDDVVSYDKRIMTIPFASEVVVIGFGTAVAQGTFVRGDLKYLQITNLDTLNFVRIRVKKNGAQTFDIKLDAGKTFILGSASESVSATGAAFSAFVDADSINMQADTGDVDIEYVVAST